jgi:hypothetical protein
MEGTPPAAAEERPLSRSAIRLVVAALAADLEEDDPGPPVADLPIRPLSRAEWTEAVALLQCRANFAEPLAPVLPTSAEPGSEAKLRALRRRHRQGVALWNARDARLPGGAAGACRALSRLADELAAQRHQAASQRATAIAVRKRTGAGEAGY